MSDNLYTGSRFRTFNVIDDFNRECLTVEIDTSITGRRLIRVFERLKYERGLPETLRVDNGPEFLSADFVAWAEQAGMAIRYIQLVSRIRTLMLKGSTGLTVRSS
jgi:putative transposase